VERRLSEQFEAHKRCTDVVRSVPPTSYPITSDLLITQHANVILQTRGQSFSEQQRTTIIRRPQRRVALARRARGEWFVFPDALTAIPAL